MSMQDAFYSEEPSFDEAPDILTAMTMPDLRHYVDEDMYDDEASGLRALLDRPETFTGSVRPGGKHRREIRVRRRSRARN